MILLSDLTPAWLRVNYFHGISMRDQNGRNIPDESVQFFINAAKEWLKGTLGIELEPVEITERHDFQGTQYSNSWGFMQTYRMPLVSVSDLSFIFNTGIDAYHFPAEWIRFNAKGGHINIVPTTTGAEQIAILKSGNLLVPFLARMDYAPQMWEVVYTAGFAGGMIPENVADVIGMKAAIQIFNELGDIIIGAGIASMSLSLDGLSQSIGTTSSATNAGYGARVLQYKKQIDEAMNELRGIYKGRSQSVG